jgi:hypothetical protein
MSMQATGLRHADYLQDAAIGTNDMALPCTYLVLRGNHGTEDRLLVRYGRTSLHT